MPSDSQSLLAVIAGELSRPLHDDARRLCDEILERHADAVTAVLFYGSCLRNGVYDDAVLDFYVLVDSYREAYPGRRRLAWANAALPPNVFLVTLEDGKRTLRAKYAVISCADFARGASVRATHAIIWARFCQPAVLAYARDDGARRAVTADVAECVVTMVETMLALMPRAADDRETAVLGERLWQYGLSLTYGTELRPERTHTIEAIYVEDAERYDFVTARALDELDSRGLIDLRVEGDKAHAVLQPGRRMDLVQRWRRTLRLAKLLYAVRLVKTAFTFGEWLPYALWKLERHTGVVIELSARQRRHPLIFGWPAIIRLIVSGRLR